MMRLGGLFMSIVLSSAAFPNGGEIPARYTCSGADISPALSWSSTPAGTKSMAVIADDPDAPMGTWTHWVIWNLPPQPANLPEGVPTQKELKSGARQGKNDFGRIGYGGPCPPPGNAHRYFFKIYALNDMLHLEAGSSKAALEQAMNGHILSQTNWMGTFRR